MLFLWEENPKICLIIYIILKQQQHKKLKRQDFFFLSEFASCMRPKFFLYSGLIMRCIWYKGRSLAHSACHLLALSSNHWHLDISALAAVAKVSPGDQNWKNQHRFRSKESAQISIKRISTESWYKIWHFWLTLALRHFLQTSGKRENLEKMAKMHFFATTVSLSRSVWFRHFPTLKHNNSVLRAATSSTRSTSSARTAIVQIQVVPYLIFVIFGTPP